MNNRPEQPPYPPSWPNSNTYYYSGPNQGNYYYQQPPIYTPIQPQGYYYGPPVKKGMSGAQIALLIIGIFLSSCFLAGTGLIGFESTYLTEENYSAGSYDLHDDSWYEDSFGSITYDVRGNWYGFEDEYSDVYYMIDGFSSLDVYAEPLEVDLGSNENKLAVYVETLISSSPYGEEIEREMIQIGSHDAVRYSFKDVIEKEEYTIDCITVLQGDTFTTVMFTTLSDYYKNYEDDILYVLDSVSINE